MRKRWWIAGILTVVLTAGFGTGNGNQQLNMAGQDGITHVYAAECPDEETEIIPFRGRESYILSEWELETEGKLEQAAMVKQYISTMTLREKVCQMIIADPENLVTTHDVTKVDAEMKKAEMSAGYCRTSETGKAGRSIRCMNIRMMVRIRHLKMRESLGAI